MFIVSPFQDKSGIEINPLIKRWFTFTQNSSFCLQKSDFPSTVKRLTEVKTTFFIYFFFSLDMKSTIKQWSNLFQNMPNWPNLAQIPSYRAFPSTVLNVRPVRFGKRTKRTKTYKRRNPYNPYGLYLLNVQNLHEHTKGTKGGNIGQYLYV